MSLICQHLTVSTQSALQTKKVSRSNTHTFLQLFDTKTNHHRPVTLDPPSRHIPIFITFRDSILGGQGGLVITKTKHLLNSTGDENKKNLQYLEFLFLIRSFQKSRHKKSSHHGTLQQLSGLKCARFDPFVSTHSSTGQGSIYATVFELQANIMGTSKHRATTSMLVILPSPERICSGIRQRDGKRMNRKTLRRNLCQET